MNQRKHGARLLGLLVVAALGVMAFAASAQAVAPGFLIAKKAVGALLATASGIQVGVGSMAVEKLNFELNCTKFTVDTGLVESNTDGTGVLLYTGCTTLSITKLPEEIHCHVAEPVKAEALLLPAEVTGTNAPAILAEGIKALVKLHLPEAALGVTPCVLPLDNTVTGSVCLAIDNNDTAEPTVLAGPAIKCTVADALLYGAQPAVLTGTAKLFLTGAHNGLTLGVSLY